MVGFIIPIGNYIANSSAAARVDPIPFHVKNDLTGLGKTTQDFRMIETTVAERRKLDSERQRKETEYQRKTREASPNCSSYIAEHADIVTGRCCPSGCTQVGNFRYPQSVLLFAL
jgi:hypothetical protein